MANLENIGMKLISRVIEQPILFGCFGVPNEKKPHRSITNECDCTRKIWIGQRCSPHGIGSEKIDAHSVELDCIARMDASPFYFFVARYTQRVVVHSATLRKCGIPECLRM